MSVNGAQGYQGITAGSGYGGQDGTLNVDAGPRAGFDPVLISLIRRSMPNLIAYDIMWRSAHVWSYWHDLRDACDV